MLELDDLPALGLFARVVQSQSFTAAARHEGLAKSAVSQRISRLEERLGKQLLLRSTRKLSLTEEGKLLYEHAAPLLALFEAAGQCALGARDDVEPVRVNAPAAVPRARLVAALRAFHEVRPDAPVHLTFDGELIDLREAPYDIVLRITPAADPTFVARRLWAGHLSIVGSPHYFAKMGRPGRPEDLLRHHCLHYAPRAIRDDWFFFVDGRRQWVQVVPTLESNDLALIHEAAIGGRGVMLCPTLTIADDVEAGRLERVLGAFMPLEIALFAISPEQKFKRPLVRAMVDHLARQFARTPTGAASVAGPPAAGGAKKVRQSSSRGRVVRPRSSRKDTRAT